VPRPNARGRRCTRRILGSISEQECKTEGGDRQKIRYGRFRYCEDLKAQVHRLNPSAKGEHPTDAVLAVGGDTPRVSITWWEVSRGWR
jgi:hypothetical protein